MQLKIKRAWFFFFLLVSFATQSLHATDSSSHYQLNAYLGGTTSVISSDTINLIGETDRLSPQGNSAHTQLTWGFGAAYRAEPPPAFQPFIKEISLGPEFFYFNTQQWGDVWQYQLPEMNNFTYQLSLKSSRVLAASEITLHPITPKAFPFLAWGLGVANNQTAFDETARPTYDSTSLTILPHHESHFAYSLGGGLKLDLSDWGATAKGMQCSFRYLYVNLGHVHTGAGASTALAAPLDVGLYTHTWVAGLSYLF